ncbi:hypothetical protein [Paenibacillus sp. L3-i20]|uniref:hypothetical protein n=1 Tax=Paenibacillus sp. L3-i20 TaxID=2905833 RepID=UPI001EDF809F|nr:hypothetical protein [Paenibacillus sp. L3-i20]GKU77516.1 hypothetical protein L3i20_v219130 [Paenibacillus sp. L3-i20]
MKKIIVIVVMLISSALILSGCTSNKVLTLDHYKDAQSINLSSETGGLSSLDRTEKEVREERGEPNVNGSMQGGGKVLEYNDYQYTFAKDKLTGFSTKEGQATGKGVKIGDGKSRVEELYGEQFTESKLDDMLIIGYADKERGLILEFALRDGVVVQTIGLRTEMFK